MNYKVPGVGSVFVLFIGAILADIQLFMESFYLGLGFLFLFPLCVLNIVFCYCRQCPHVVKGTCRHVIFGRIVKKFFTLKQPKPYRMQELVTGMLPVIVLILAAQYWLIRNLLFFVGFWIMTLIAVMIIRTSVCKTCENTHCALCPNAKQCNQ